MIASAAPRTVISLLLVASVAVVGGALLFQYVGGLEPCELCLYQRWPYYAAIVATGVALLSGGERAMEAVIALCGLLFAASTVLALYHVGVEHHLFAGPTACTGSLTGPSSVQPFKPHPLSPPPMTSAHPPRRP